MHILQVHNCYRDPGGEEVVLEKERLLLIANGHIVTRHLEHNSKINTSMEKLGVAIKMPYSIKQKKKLKVVLLRENPDIVHVHNFLPVLTSSIFDACNEIKIPVVITLHNFRLLCINGLFYRDGKTCFKCRNNKIPYHGIIHGCYQNSKLISIFPVIANSYNSLANIWTTKIDKFIFLSDYHKQIFLKSHIRFKENQISIKSNFVYDNGFSYKKENFYLYVGRLSEEKGIFEVIESFSKTGLVLKIAGEGPLNDKLRFIVRENSNIIFLGRLTQPQLGELYKSAKATIFASKLLEGMPMVILESFSYATPVLVSKNGNAEHLVQNNYNGMHFDISKKLGLNECLEMFEKTSLDNMAIAARKTYEEHYKPDDNLKVLENIYSDVLNSIKN